MFQRPVFLKFWTISLPPGVKLPKFSQLTRPGDNLIYFKATAVIRLRASSIHFLVTAPELRTAGHTRMFMRGGHTYLKRQRRCVVLELKEDWFATGEAAGGSI